MDASNAVDLEKYERFIDEIEKCDEELLSEWGVYASRCRAIRDRKAEWKDHCKDIGVPRAVVNADLKERKLRKELEAVTEKLEGDDLDLFKYVTGKLGQLGDTPLGQAAGEAAQKEHDEAKGGRGRRSRRGRDEAAPDPDEEEAKAAAENASRLASGISQLN